MFCTSSFTALEFIARGCAVGVCCSTFNQREYYDALPKLGIAKPIGSFINNEWQLDLSQISLLMSSDILRKQLSKKSLELCDFFGVPRIIESIFSFGSKKWANRAVTLPSVNTLIMLSTKLERKHSHSCKSQKFLNVLQGGLITILCSKLYSSRINISILILILKICQNVYLRFSRLQ